MPKSMDQPAAMEPKSRLWPAILVLCLSLVAMLATWRELDLRHQAALQERLAAETTRLANKIVWRMSAYEQILRGAAGLFAAAPEPGRQGWHRYVEMLDLDQTYRGIQGVGFAIAIPPERLDEVTRRVRAEGYADFTVHPAGARDAYGAILYLEPFTGRNRRSFGYDLLSDPLRRAAMEQARDLGTIAYSAKLKLLQETGNDQQAGILVFHPVYASGALTHTVEQRRAALLGWAYAPFRMRDLMEAVLKGEVDGLRVEIFDGTTTDPAALLYDSAASAAPSAAAGQLAPAVLRLDLAQHAWTLRCSPQAGFARALKMSPPWVELAAIAVISLLACATTWFWVNTRNRAAAIAAQLTASLRDSEERYRTLFRRCKLPMLLIEPAGGRIVDANEAAAHFYGYPVETLRQMAMSALDAAEGDQVVLELTLGGGAVRPGLYFRHRLAGGEVREVEVHANPIQLGGQALVYALILDVTERLRMETALRHSEESYRMVMEAAQDAIFISDNDGLLLYCNPAALRLTGYPAGGLAGRPFADLLEAKEKPRLGDHLSILRRGLACNEEWSMRRADGTLLLAELSTVQLSDGRLLAVGRDVSARRQAVERLRLAANVFAETSEGIVIADSAANIIDANRSFSELTGYDRDELIGQHVGLLRSGHHDDAFFVEMGQRLLDEGHWRGELWVRRKDGGLLAAWVNISAVRDERNRATQYIALCSDVTERKRKQQEVEHFAYYDPLTNLPNRLLLADRMAQALARAARQKSLVAVCYVDLDNFKPINDIHGHKQGDGVLVEVAARLLQSVRTNDTVARLGGDEFVLLLSDLASPVEWQGVIGRVLEAVKAPYILEDGAVVRISASIGVTLFPEDGGDADTLLRHADQAMYEAKRAGSDRAAIYEKPQPAPTPGEAA